MLPDPPDPRTWPPLAYDTRKHHFGNIYLKLEDTLYAKQQRKAKVQISKLQRENLVSVLFCAKSSHSITLQKSCMKIS